MNPEGKYQLNSLYNKPSQDPHIRENVKSILKAAMDGALSTAQAGAYLALAHEGNEVYCYTAGPDQNWYLWDGTASDPQTGHKGVRIPLTKK